MIGSQGKWNKTVPVGAVTPSRDLTDIGGRLVVDRTCSISDCNLPVHHRDWCNGHYKRWWRYGDPLGSPPPRPTESERFWSKVNRTDDCWLWTASSGPRGYGQFNMGDPENKNSKVVQAHRYTYELYVEPIPIGATVEQVCGNILCVRPEHLTLEPALRRKNPTPCVDPGCYQASEKAGYCNMHYARLRKRGTTELVADEDRFWARVDKTDTCWNWRPVTGGADYGQFSVNGRGVRAHVYSYRLHVGDIPPGVFIDHRCHNRRCVNPEHLRLATAKQNMENLRNNLPASNTSGYRGVSYDPSRNLWRASVVHEGRRIFLGRFSDVTEAAEAARLKRNELFTHNDLDRIGETRA